MLLHEKALMIQRLRFSVSSAGGRTALRLSLLKCTQRCRIGELSCEKKRGLPECGLEESSAGDVVAASLALELTAKSAQNSELAACKALARLKK